MMGGTIEASSTPGQGSVFTVRLALPRTVSLAEYDRQAEAGNSIIAGDGPGLPGGRLKVLLAEDHPTNQRVVGLILEPLDIALRIEADGASALAAFKAERFDLVLMDMQMPVMDGLSAVKEIRRHEAALGLPRTPIAMLSANAMADHIEQAIAAGCDLHIAKPVTPHSLLQGVACALALRPPREPSEAAA
jgi:CheY-like chemotaxis protein